MNLVLDDQTLAFIRLLLAQAGINTGSDEGVYIEKASITARRLLVHLSNGFNVVTCTLSSDSQHRIRLGENARLT